MTMPATGVRGHLKFLAKDSVIYGLGAAFNRAITLITFPLLARHFSVQDFGIIDLLNTLVVLVITLLVFGQDSAVARYFYDDENKVARQQVVSQSFAFQLGILALAIPPMLMLSRPLSELLTLGADGESIIRLMVLQLPFFLLINFSQGILKWTFRRGPFLFISVGSTLGTLAGLLLALEYSDLSVVDLFTIYLAVRATFGLAGLWFVRQWLSWPTGFDKLRLLVPFAVPFGIVCAITALVPFIERHVVASLIGTEALGIFAAGAKVAMLIALVINAFETSWGPFSLSIFREPDASRTFRAVLNVVVVGLCGTTLLLTAFGDLVVILLGSSKYAGAGQVVFALTMALTIQSIGAITEVGIMFSKRTHLKLYAYGLGLLVSAVAIPLLGSRFGVAGVAWGSLAGYTCKTVLEAWLAQRAHQIHWQFAGPISICVLTLMIGLMHQLWFDQAVLYGVRWIPLVGLLLLLGLVWFVMLDSGDRVRVLQRRQA